MEGHINKPIDVKLTSDELEVHIRMNVDEALKFIETLTAAVLHVVSEK